ncbi:hypothetical protein [Methylobacterium sp. J-070]|uniref:hypothetical protein n=1 Tax=Methylobacterium sp. J-070 TaxID=2836650 RepID=UPI001FBAC9E0|nr:hypothetical protein [Methylobacterium sp. J-070]MCJ2052412.1 hypothetical protein [Methylobacterium sp. J-070]
MTIEGRFSERLSEIAAVMGCSVESFYLPESKAHEASLTIELLRLWSAIDDPQARQRILSTARREAVAAAVLKAAE